MFWRRKPRTSPTRPADTPQRRPARSPIGRTSCRTRRPTEPARGTDRHAGRDPVPDWIARHPADLVAGLEKSRTGFVGRLRGFLGGGPTGPSWDDVEETLIAGDVGASLAMDIVERARARRDPDGPEAAVRAELAALLVPRDPGEWRPQPAGPGSPAVILVVGVNGTGKTTTIGKLASRYRDEGMTVLLAAADTFRAAAIEQLGTWAAAVRRPDRRPCAGGGSRARSCSTPSTPRSPAGSTWSSPTPPGGSTRRST